MSATDIARATGGRIVRGDPSTAVGRVTIDSRNLQAGDFFVAIRGDRFDGHQFLPDAARSGAIGAMVHQAPASPEAGMAMPALLIEVGDTTRALQDLAREVRRRSGARVVAITGSAGKTTTKEVIAEFLSARFDVFRNKGNLNNHIGLPLSLLELRARPEVAVVELGMNHAGEIRTLVGIAEPEVRVWTNVGDAHLGFFASSEAIADAKSEILEAADRSHVLVANANDPRVLERAARFPGRVVTFGIDTDADVRASQVQLRGLEGMAAEVTTSAGTAHLQTPLLGLGNLSNVLAGLAVGLHFGVPLDEMIARAGRLSPAHHRGEILRLPGGITLIDDSYNSSPAALARSLETVGVGDRQRAQSCRARRDARAGFVRRFAAPAIGRARHARGTRSLDNGRRGTGGRDGRRGDRGRHAGTMRLAYRDEDRGGRRRPASGARRRPGARQRLTRDRH